ncbi:TPA: hypothetical protein HA239_02395 [Candidatus Woesearchaeota archaeon]|nr:hypothetical protein QT06_C0001G1083 [archaeon GW2011_AR15]MBS3104446.1 hypothetical protein [Candidatus Woesearchaeota archaeon]HIH41239.1 hypothetical protein [Candidatus Woesearchaeota archaeon]
MSDEESLEEKIAAIGKRTKSMLSDFHVLLKSGDFKGIYVPEFIQFETMWLELGFYIDRYNILYHERTIASDDIKEGSLGIFLLNQNKWGYRKLLKHNFRNHLAKRKLLHSRVKFTSPDKYLETVEDYLNNTESMILKLSQGDVQHNIKYLSESIAKKGEANYLSELEKFLNGLKEEFALLDRDNEYGMTDENRRKLGMIGFDLNSEGTAYSTKVEYRPVGSLEILANKSTFDVRFSNYSMHDRIAIINNDNYPCLPERHVSGRIDISEYPGNYEINIYSASGYSVLKLLNFIGQDNTIDFQRPGNIQVYVNGINNRVYTQSMINIKMNKHPSNQILNETLKEKKQRK